MLMKRMEKDVGRELGKVRGGASGGTVLAAIFI